METASTPWMEQTITGTLIGIAGLLISFFGFAVSLWQIARSRKASEGAKLAAEAARSDLFKLDAIYECSTSVAALEEALRLVQLQAWQLVPDRIILAKRGLTHLKGKLSKSDPPRATQVEATIVRLNDFETLVRRFLIKGSPPPDINRLCISISAETQSMSEILTQIRLDNTRSNYV